MQRVTPLLLLVAGCAGPAVAPGNPGALTGVAPLQSLGALSTDFDVEHYRIELAIDAQRQEIAGRCTVRFFPLVDGLGSVNFDLTGLEAKTVAGADGAELEFAQFEGKLRIALPEGARRGRALEVVISYGGHPASGLWFGRGQCSAGGTPDGARGWFPAQDHPADLATVELLLDLPEAWIGATGGEQVEAATRAGRRHERWRIHAPHAPFRTGFVAGNFLPQVAGEHTYLRGLQDASSGGSPGPELDTASSLVGFLTELTGKRYPYPSLTLVELTGRPAGAGAPLGIVALGPDDDQRTQDLVGGIARQWFGGLVTCADWSEAWLQHGLAEHAADRWTETTRGQEAAQIVRDDRIASALAAHAQRPRPLVHGRCREAEDLFDLDHLADGGAARLHMLRRIVGEEAFFAGLRRFVAEHAGTSVRTTDLLQALAGEAGVDPRAWFEVAGQPALEVFWAHDQERGRVLLSVNQVHEITGGVPAVYELPLDVDLGLGTQRRRHRVQLTARRALFEIPVDAAPRWVLVDPEAWLPVTITTRKELDEWRAIAEEAGVVGRRRAVRALAEPTRAAAGEERAAGIELLIGRLAVDGSEAVRSEAARSLGVIGGDRARQALLNSATDDQVSAVRARALRSLCAVGADPELAQLGRTGYRRHATADEAEAAALLVACADPDGAAQWLRSELAAGRDPALLAALARVDVQQAADEADRWAFNASEAIDRRVAATRVLAGLLRRKPDLSGRLGELLRVGPPAVQDAAVDALAAAGAGDGPRRLLAAFYPLSSTPHQRRRIEQVFGR